jgi:hypothetical protein
MKRLLLIGIGSLLVLGLLGSVGLWLFLSRWVPVQGKALIVQELERGRPIHVSIESMRYELLRGLIVDRIRVVQRDTDELWAEAPLLQLQVNRLALLTRNAVFRGRAQLEHPAKTTLTFSGQYRMRERSLLADIETGSLPVQSLAPPLSRLVPPELSGGEASARLHLELVPGLRPVITGRVDGNEIAWTAKPWRFAGDVTVEGMAQPPASEGEPWSFEAKVALRRGMVEGLPGIGSLTRLEGMATLDHETIDIQSLTGELFGSPWTLEGTVILGPRGSFEGLWRSPLKLASAVEAFPDVAAQWQADGTAEIRAVCRGSLQPRAPVDCLARTQLRDASLSGARLAHPLQEMRGALDYDLLTRQLTLDQLEGRLMKKPFTVSGRAWLTSPPMVDLAVDGELPLEMALPWLPADHPVSDLSGTATVDVLRITGRAPALTYDGAVTIADGSARLTRPAMALDDVQASVRLSVDEIDASGVSLRLNDQPLTGRATVVLEEVPRITAIVGFRGGELETTARLRKEDTVIDRGLLSLDTTRLAFQGTVARLPSRASRLTYSGAIALEELDRVPFFSTNALAAWKAQGVLNVRGDFSGSLADWRSGSLGGELRSDRLMISQIPIEQLSAAFEQSGRVLRLRIPAALIAEGKFWSELTVEHRRDGTSCFFKGDLVGLQLERLAQIIPAWRSRSATGMASGEALITGLLERRGSWSGEGWVSAEGERLGDLPLLDKLFNGLFGLLGERLGLESLRRAQINQASVRWKLADERFHTNDLRLGGVAGAEPVAIYAKGSVGFDQTLDFVIEPELSEGIVLQSPSTSTLASTVLKAAGQLERLRRLIGRHRLTGTVKEPNYRFELSTQEVLKSIAPGPADFLQNLFDAVR